MFLLIGVCDCVCVCTCVSMLHNFKKKSANFLLSKESKLEATVRRMIILKAG